ncbi:DUF4212 domain-containing protein [Paraburkholderia sp.]|uniref:DUF4212 domain-containing protein n=1 Tax=Paraburkholderia sp. TaxID=1926495 RepID=UPI002389BFCD|nr:DUF4212 domain-containing protein [Paraburkholderia sp.]MDE1184521.1 DUF4212 domain-containing protein [Paraburkholderia sp.]
MAAPHPHSRYPLQPSPEPPAVSAAMAFAHRRYWRFNIALIVALMAIGFVVSFVVPLIAPSLASARFAGFGLPFYLGAQGAILIYVALIVVYIVAMQRADRTLQRAFDADAASASAATSGVNGEINGQSNDSADSADPDARISRR